MKIKQHIYWEQWFSLIYIVYLIDVINWKSNNFNSWYKLGEFYLEHVLFKEWYRSHLHRLLTSLRPHFRWSYTTLISLVTLEEFYTVYNPTNLCCRIPRLSWQSCRKAKFLREVGTLSSTDSCTFRHVYSIFIHFFFSTRFSCTNYNLS